MDPISFALSVVAAAETGPKLARKLCAMYQAYENAEEEINQKLLLLNHGCMKIEFQIEVLRQMWRTLPPKMQVLQNLVLQQYETVLQKAITRFDCFLSEDGQEPSIARLSLLDRRVKKARFSAFKSSLDETLNDLKNWQREYDPSWYLLGCCSASIIDQELVKKPESRPDNGRETMVAQKNLQWIRDLRTNLLEGNSDGATTIPPIFIPSTSVSARRNIVVMSGVSSLSKSELLQEKVEVLIDLRECLPGQSTQQLELDIRSLARSFYGADPLSLGVLRCRGVVRLNNSEGHTEAFELIFETPQTLTNPRTLRELLSSAPTNPTHPLNERLQMARLLARSVSSIHAAQFVHKNIAPESVLVFQDGSSSLGIPFLMGFDMFRYARGHTYRVGDKLWERNLYRHPKRQGRYPDENYVMQHDIYSLGVCLLEIGLWTTFVRWDNGHNDPKASDALDSLPLSSIRDRHARALKTKEFFEELAMHRLPAIVGEKYTNIVLTCLTCLDQEGNKFGNKEEFEDEDGILVGIRYIEKVLIRLEEIAL